MLGALPLFGGIAAFAAAHLNSSLRIVGFGFAVMSVVTLTLAIVAILNNVGKETYFAPLSIGDLIPATADDTNFALVPVQKASLVKEYYEGIFDSEIRNNDSIDRLHFAHAWFFVAVFIASTGAALTVGAIVSEPTVDSDKSAVSQPPVAALSPAGSLQPGAQRAPSASASDAVPYSSAPAPPALGTPPGTGGGIVPPASTTASAPTTSAGPQIVRSAAPIGAPTGAPASRLRPGRPAPIGTP
jgi:hypothetical protein